MSDDSQTTAEPFDICDSKNRYLPCAKCGSTWGMGLTSCRADKFIRCSHCEHEGPHTPASGVWHENDRAAFNAWNSESREGMPTNVR